MLSPHEQRVCTAIAARADALLADLKLHVGLPTGGRNTVALDDTRERLTARAQALGATLQLIEGTPRPPWLYGETLGQSPLPTVVCRKPSSSPGARPILIAGHLDTVHDPRGPFQSLTPSPDGLTAIGPGCVDMKGGLVIAIAALEALAECGWDHAWTLLLNSDEETGSYHSFQAIFDEARRTHEAGGVGIALEPAAAGDALVIERAGSGQFVIEARGKAAHVGRDFTAGVSAVQILAQAITRISTLVDAKNNVIVNIGPLQGGTATNVVPDLARAWGNVRFSTPEQGDALKATMQHIVDTSELPACASLTIDTSFARPAKPATPEVMRFAELCKAAADDLRQPLPFAKTAGVCDGNIMQAAGLPTLDTLGVRGGGLHTPDEWIELSSLVERCQLLAVVLMRCRNGPQAM